MLVFHGLAWSLEARLGTLRVCMGYLKEKSQACLYRSLLLRRWRSTQTGDILQR